MSSNRIVYTLLTGLFLLLLVGASSPEAYGKDPAFAKDLRRAAPGAEKERAAVTLANANISLEFDVDNDLRLSSVEQVVTGAMFTMKDKQIWKIYIRDINTGFELLVSPTTHSYTFSHTYNDYGTYKEIVANWDNIVIDANDTLDSVIVTATLDNDAKLADMKIQVDSDLTDYSLFRIFFPDFYLQAIGGNGSDDRFTFPQHGGYIIDDPINRLGPLGWPHPGQYAMQFFTYFDDSGLLYMGTDDAVGHVKIFATIGHATENAIYWRLEHFPQDHTLPGQVSYTAPYNYQIGAIDGDWYDVCMMYREWGLENIVTAKRIDDPDTGFNPILKDIDGLSGYNLGIPSEGLSPAILQGMKDAKAYYDVDRVATILYLWTNEPTAVALWPDVTPVANVKDGIAAMKADNDVVFMYTQIACNVNAPSYINNNWDIYALERLDGTLYYNHPMVNMDQTIPFWQTHSLNWNIDFADMLEYDGVFWDYWSGYNHPCYNPSHGHPLGGGAHNTQGKQAEAEMVISSMNALPGHENWFITSEYVSEFFIDYNVIEMWNEELWDESAGQMPMIRMPLYETIYGDRQYVWNLTQTNKMNGPHENLMCYTVASRMTAGLILGFVGTSEYPFHPEASLPYGEVAFQFLGKLMRTYDFSRKYTMWGQLMRNVQVNSVGSIPYYDVQTNPTNMYTNHWIYTSSFPDISNVMPSVWKSEKDPLNPTFAIFLINWRDTQQTINYTFKFDDYGLSKGRSHVIKSLDENGSIVIDHVSDDFTRNEVMEARSIKILEIMPKLQMTKPGDIEPL